MKNGRPQAKDISDAAALDAVNKARGNDRTTAWWTIAERLPAYPAKVVLAKLRSMVRRGKLGAQCTCGCRGDFTPDVGFWYGEESRTA